MVSVRRDLKGHLALPLAMGRSEENLSKNLDQLYLEIHA